MSQSPPSQPPPRQQHLLPMDLDGGSGEDSDPRPLDEQEQMVSMVLSSRSMSPLRALHPYLPWSPMEFLPPGPPSPVASLYLGDLWYFDEETYHDAGALVAAPGTSNCGESPIRMMYIMCIMAPHILHTALVATSNGELSWRDYTSLVSSVAIAQVVSVLGIISYEEKQNARKKIPREIVEIEEPEATEILSEEKQNARIPTEILENEELEATEILPEEKQNARISGEILEIEEPEETDAQNSKRSNMSPRGNTGNAPASIDVVQHQHHFSEEPINAAKSRAKPKVWKHFTKDGARAYCKYCSKEYKADSRKHGTSRLWRHLEGAHSLKVVVDGDLCEDSLQVSDMPVIENEEPMETDAQNSGSRHCEPHGYNTLNSTGNAAASTDAVQHNFSGEPINAAKPKVWKHFTKDGARASCKYCSKYYAADSRKHGTSRLWRHLEGAHKMNRASSSKDGN